MSWRPVGISGVESVTAAPWDAARPHAQARNSPPEGTPAIFVRPWLFPFGSGLRLVLLVVVRSFLGRFGPRQHRLDRAAHDAHLDAVGDLDDDFLALGRLGDGADDAPAGDHFVAAAERTQHRLMVLHLLLLGADQEEIEDHENEHEGGDRHDVEATCGAARRLRIGRCTEHACISPCRASGPGFWAELPGQAAGRAVPNDLSAEPWCCAPLRRAEPYPLGRPRANGFE